MEPESWQPLQFEPTSSIKTQARQVGLALANYYGKSPDRSRSAWLKGPISVAVSWDPMKKMPDGTKVPDPRTSHRFTILDIDRLLEDGTFKPEALNVPPPMCPWLDPEFVFGWDAHLVDDDKSEAVNMAATPLIHSLPLTPKMDREGFTANGLQGLIMRQLRADFHTVVDESSRFRQNTWFWTLRQLVCDTVGLVDILLTMIYLKAQYEPEPRWKFDPRKLGSRHSRRLSDKISWVSQITGSSVSRPKADFDALMRIKDVRNHLQHFDPPVLALTLDDVARWLADIQGVFRLILWIRQQISTPPPVPLIELLLIPKVAFHAKYPHRRRVSQPPGSGYASVCWPPSESIAPDVHVCRCSPPRMLAIRPSVAEGGAIICGECRKVFKPWPG